MNENSKNLIEGIINNEGNNVQTLGTVSRLDSEKELKLYLVSKRHGLKSFTVSETLKLVFTGESYGCAFGTTTDKKSDICKDKIGVVVVWE